MTVADYVLEEHLGMNRCLCRKAALLPQRKLFSVIEVFSCGEDNEPISPKNLVI